MRIKAVVLKRHHCSPQRFAPIDGHAKLTLQNLRYNGGSVMSRNTNQIEKPKGPIMNADRLAVEWLRCQRRRVGVLAVALTACGAIGLVPQTVRSDVLVVDVVAVAKGMRTDDLKGKPVLNEKNERIGTLDDLVIGKDRVLFAILQVGGLLGLGSHFVAVPYQSLQISEVPTKIVLPGASKEALKNLPEFKYHV
jgi:sporulation protein YlmC with PRC-barrel domain